MTKKPTDHEVANLTAGILDLETVAKVRRLESSFENGALSRRGFMTGALALGVSLTAASAVLKKAEAATPKKGGRMRQALTGGGSGDSLDPGQILDTYMINVSFGQLRNNLTEIAPNGDLVGELAESWDASADAKTWAFKLRKGVEFHNGKSLDATDVAVSLQHHLGEDSKSAAKGILSGIESVKADGKDTVVVELTGGNADFAFLMSDYHLGVCPANSDGSLDWQSGVGTGGYSLGEHDPGVRTLTKRNPNYWKEGRAHFDEVENAQVADANARSNGLQTGEFDVITSADAKTVNLLGKTPGIEILQTTGNKHFVLPMHTDTAPFDNNHVRLALKYAVDREQWLKLILRGFGVLGNDSPIGPANTYYATEEEMPQRHYDLDKAKYHLKQAGLSSLKVQFHCAETGFPGSIDAGQLFRESAAPAGIDIEVIREPDDGYWSNVWLVKPWSAGYWGGRPTEDYMFSQVYSEGATWNETKWKHARFNELLVAARAELDTKKRRQQYVEMQRIVSNEGGALIPLFSSYIHAHTDKVQMGSDVAANWELDGHKDGERWWFS